MTSPDIESEPAGFKEWLGTQLFDYTKYTFPNGVTVDLSDRGKLLEYYTKYIAPDLDSEGAKSGEITSSRTQAKEGESEELDGILDKAFWDVCLQAFADHAAGYSYEHRYGLEETKQKLLQWRTKSLLEELLEINHFKANEHVSAETISTKVSARIAALQDIKKGVEK